jgi:hypothetical protein
MADDAGEAVDKAVEQWKDWLTDADDPIPRTLPTPHIVKAYRNSWITDIARDERYSGFLGIHAMRTLSNRGSD